MEITRKIEINPSPGRYIIRCLPIKPRDKRKGSDIIVPDQYKKRKEVEGDLYSIYPYQAIIVAVGKYRNPNGLLTDDTAYKFGDIIYLETWPPEMTTFIMFDRPYHHIRESHIICKNTNVEEFKILREDNKDTFDKELKIKL